MLMAERFKHAAAPRKIGDLIPIVPLQVGNPLTRLIYVSHCWHARSDRRKRAVGIS